MIRRILFGGGARNQFGTDIGLLFLRVIAGLSMMTIFEKLLPRDGIWGPQDWFVSDVAEMGFPAPLFFAWCAVLAEFVGGFLVLVGLLTRPATVFLGFTMFVAAFIHHDMDLFNKGLKATIFLGLYVSLFCSGAGRYSADMFLSDNLEKGKIAG